MCHLLLLAPVFGLLIFWLSPIWVAAPVYSVILLLSILLYVVTIRVMRLPQITGVYSLLQRARESRKATRHDPGGRAASEPTGPRRGDRDVAPEE